MKDYTDKEREEIQATYGDMGFTQLVAAEAVLKEELDIVHTFMDRIGRIEFPDNK